MELTKCIPQYLPMMGEKVRVRYAGMDRLCNKCFQAGHFKADCKNQKVDWLDFVNGFMNFFKDIPREMYGAWAAKIEQRANYRAQLDTDPHLDMAMADLNTQELVQDQQEHELEQEPDKGKGQRRGRPPKTKA